MNWIRLFESQLRACLRDVLSLAFLLLAVFAGLFSMFLEAQKQPDKLCVAIAIEDTGAFGERLCSSLEEQDFLSIVRLPREDAMAKLRRGDIEALIVVKENYTQRLREGNFEDTLLVYSAPSSRAVSTVTEPAINRTMMMWVEESAVMGVKSYLHDNGIAFTEDDEAKLRQELERLWHNGNPIVVEPEYLGGFSQTPQDTLAGAFDAAVRWYGMFCMFYLIAGASWALDMNNVRLRMRASQRGAQRWQLVTGSALAPLLLTMAGYVAMGCAASAFMGARAADVLRLLLPVCLYLCGVLGIMLAVTSAVTNLMPLLFLAPILTFLHAMLSGMLFDLPVWADVLRSLSVVLPGRWLQSALATGFAALPGALFCALGWSLFGRLLSLTREKLTHTQS